MRSGGKLSRRRARETTLRAGVSGSPFAEPNRIGIVIELAPALRQMRTCDAGSAEKYVADSPGQLRETLADVNAAHTIIGI